jgi:geranylgeranyl diphosphate synthase type II
MKSPESASPSFLDKCESDRSAVERRLRELVDTLAAEHQGIHEAISYCLLGGGKRLRPILCLWTHDLVGGNWRDVALDAACAIECVHTYSLIHDDLPCMDDDDYRRGRPSAHKKFGEATAVLTGDALLTLAFHVIATLPRRFPDMETQRALEVSEVLSFAAGTGGLITGQALDLAGSAATGDLEAVSIIHRNKTAMLISASMEIGAVCGGVSPDIRTQIRESGLKAGEAFQIIDDVLDCVTDRETLGKTPGKDAASDKLTWPAMSGIENARAAAVSLVREAKDGIAGCSAGTSGERSSGKIQEMFDFLVERGA